MVEKKKVNVGWILYNNIIDSVGPTKGLWFPAIIKKLCIQSGVLVDKNEEKVKAGLAINAKASANGPQIGGQRISREIMEEIKKM